MKLEEFLKMLEEDNSLSGEEFIAKVLDKEKEKENAELKTLKQNLHETIDAIENEKELKYFCWKMGMIVFDYFRKNVVGEE